MMDFRVSLNVELVSSLFKSLWIWDIGFFKVFFDVRILTKRVFVSLDIADDMKEIPVNFQQEKYKKLSIAAFRVYLTARN
ncbi:unnamed protein product [Rhizophagus irregularis]|nr:unnamed protein product [Rhizophagus irregularis]